MALHATTATDHLAADVAVYESLSTHQDVVLAVFFIGFFGCTLLAAVLSERRPTTRRTYVAVFFVLLLVSNVTGLSIFPFMHWYKFSEPRGQEVTSYEIRVADADGNEIVYDARAAPPLINSMSTLARHMHTDYDTETRERVARHLLTNANAYRDRVEHKGADPAGLLAFPRHTLDYRWTEERLQGHSTFVSVRVYKLTTRTTDDGTELASRTDELVLEVTPGGDVTREDGTAPIRREAAPTRHGGTIAR